jgi:glycosyltransferase involved in cell wall biosynthesis
MTELSLKIANVSIIIPTRNRPDDLKRLLDSIMAQTVLPNEIIVIDDSSGVETKDLVESVKEEFLAKGVLVKYLRGGEKGVAQKRNIGAFHSTGDVCFFIDDDIILDKKYVEKILEVYEKYPNALGVAGHIISQKPPSKLSNIIRRILLEFHCSYNSAKVRPIGISYPYPLTRIINCEWLNAGTVSYKRAVFKEFKWDEALMTYSISEDKDLSYRIYKRYPNSLFMTPYAKAFHAKSKAGRFSNKYVTYMGVAHTVYVFYKNFKQTLRNVLSFYYGLFIGHLIHQILSRDPFKVIHQIGAYFCLFKNFKEIRNGNFTFLDKIAN